jgi:hypothetical protein
MSDIVVSGPDGSTFTFPEGTAAGTITDALSAHYGAQGTSRGGNGTSAASSQPANDIGATKFTPQGTPEITITPRAASNGGVTGSPPPQPQQPQQQPQAAQSPQPQALPQSSSQSAPQPPQPQSSGILSNIAAGANDAIYTGLGAPVDLARGAENLVPRAINAVAGTDIPIIPSDTVGGKEWIEQQAGRLSPALNPENTTAATPAEQIARGAGGGLGLAMVPESALAALEKVGVIAPELAAKIAPYIGRSATAGDAVVNATSGAAAGAGSETAQQAAPDSLKPVAGVVGGLAGGAIGLGASQIPRTVAVGLQGVKDAAAPLTEAGQKQLAAAKVQQAATSKDAALEALETAPGQVVPGSQPTTFQQTGDMGLGGLEREAQTKAPADFMQRRAEQNGAQVAAVKGIQEEGAPEQVATAFRQRLDQIDQETQAAVDSATQKAHSASNIVSGTIGERATGLGQAAAASSDAAAVGAQGAAMAIGLGLEPEAAGATIRSGLDTSYRQRLEQIDQQTQAAVDDAASRAQSHATSLAGTISDRATGLGQTSQSTADVAARNAQDATQTIGLGTEPETAGAAIRSGLETARAGAKDQERQLWNAVDPDGTLALAPAQTQHMATQIAAEMPVSAGPMGAAESAIHDVIGQYGDAVPLREMSALRTRIGEAISTEKTANNGVETSLSRRLGMLYSAIGHDLQNAVAAKVENESQAVAQGKIDPEQTAAFRINQWQDDWRQRQEAARANDTGSLGPNGAGRTTSVSGPRGATSQTGIGPGNSAGDQGLSADGGANFDQAALDRLNAARTATAQRASTFDNKTLGPIRARPSGSAPYNMPAAGVAARVFVPGPKGFETLQTYRQAVTDPAAMDAVEQYAIGRLNNSALRPDGTLDPARAATFQRTYSDALRAFPALNQRIETAVAASNDAAAAASESAATNKLTAKMAQAATLPDGTIDAAKLDAWRQKNAAALAQFPDLAEKFKDVQSASATLATASVARKTALGDIQSDALGHMVGMPASAVAARVFVPGPKGFETLQTYRQAVTDPAAMDAIEQYAINRLRNSALRPDGTLDPARAATFQRTYSDALRAFPALNDRINQAIATSNAAAAASGQSAAMSKLTAKMAQAAALPDGTLDAAKLDAWRQKNSAALAQFPDLAGQFKDVESASSALATASAARKAALDDAQKGALGRLIGVTAPEDVTRTVGGLFSRQDAVQQFTNLRGAVGANADAQQGLRKAIVDYIAGRFVGNTEAATSGIGTVKSDSFQTFVRQNKAALKAAGFSDDEIGTMSAVAADLRRANRSNASIKLPAGSNTAQDQVSILRQIAQATRSNTGMTVEGAGIGGALGSIAGPIGSAVGAAAGAGAGRAFAAARQAGLDSVDKIVADAMLNPGRAKILLQTPLTPRAQMRSWSDLGSMYKRATISGIAGASLTQGASQ